MKKLLFIGSVVLGLFAGAANAALSKVVKKVHGVEIYETFWNHSSRIVACQDVKTVTTGNNTYDIKNGGWTVYAFVGNSLFILGDYMTGGMKIADYVGYDRQNNVEVYKISNRFKLRGMELYYNDKTNMIVVPTGWSEYTIGECETVK